MKKMWLVYNFRFIAALCLLGTLLFSCEAFTDKDIAIPALPETPTIEITPLADNPNRILVKDLSDGFFSRVWDLPGGTPNRSTLPIDTILFTKAGTYTISLHAAKEGGGGTATASKMIIIEQDAAVSCSDEITLLVGGCEPASSKCWTFAKVSGAITVGPEPGSGEWFTSPEAGLVPEQYDDAFCFGFDGASFQYNNSGSTVDPWNGYQAVAYTPPTDHTWLLVPEGGENGETRIVLTEGSFMGVWDSGPLYDIIELSESKLIVRSKIVGADGWFELTFISL